MEKKVLKMPMNFIFAGWYTLIVGIVATVLCIVFKGFGEFENIFQVFLVILLFLPIDLCGLYLAVCLALWKVEMYDEYFTYRNWFGIKKTYRYEDLAIDTTKAWSKTYFYLNGKKVLAIAYWIEDGNYLEKMVKKKRKQKEKREKLNKDSENDFFQSYEIK